MTTKRLISPDFPGACSGKGRSWERKKREEIGLLPDKHGFSPGIVGINRSSVIRAGMFVIRSHWRIERTDLAGNELGTY